MTIAFIELARPRHALAVSDKWVEIAQTMDNARIAMRSRSDRKWGLATGAQDQLTEEKDSAMKSLLGGASALAMILGLSAPGFAADVRIDGSSALGADAVSANIQSQDVTNSVDITNSSGINTTGTNGKDHSKHGHDRALYDGEMRFDTHTFNGQGVDVNNFNTGWNAAQQGGISIAVALDIEADTGLNLGGAVAANVLDQVSSNSISVNAALADAPHHKVLYDSEMHFGTDTFSNQAVVVNNFNTGWNAAQQGGIAIAVGAGVAFNSSVK